MNRFISINPNRCVACGTCRAACSEGHRKAGLLDEPRLALYESRDVVASLTCHHCSGAPCTRVCPVDAIQRCDDGCVRVDEHRCVGCKLCAVTCPFGAIHMFGTPISGIGGLSYKTPTFPASTDPILQWEVGVYSTAVKCDLCEYDDCHPHCVDACITNALRLVECPDEDEDIAARRVKAGRESLVMLENLDGDSAEEGETAVESSSSKSDGTSGRASDEPDFQAAGNAAGGSETGTAGTGGADGQEGREG